MAYSAALKVPVVRPVRGLVEGAVADVLHAGMVPVMPALPK